MNKLKQILFYSFLTLISLPLFFTIIKIVETKPLEGSIEKAKKPTISINSILNGSFQNDYEKYINDGIWYRPELVRLHNQLQFTLFNEVNAKGVIQGKENFLYEEAYIKAYYGTDFIGTEKIKNRINKLIELRNLLKQYNIEFIVCLTPGKGYYFPEYFPDKMRGTLTDSTNINVFNKQIKETDLNFINFHSWFLEMKKENPECMLFPRLGIHWSQYGVFLAADSLVHYVENLLQISMPQFVLKDIEQTDKLRGEDFDISRGMNLIFRPKADIMCYPIYDIIADENSVKPATLVVSDSFYGLMIRMNMQKDIFDLGAGFWYYNYWTYKEDPVELAAMLYEINIKEELLSNELVIMMVTDANLTTFPWGFPDTVSHALPNIHLP